MDEQGWLDSLRSFMDGLLAPIIKDRNERAKYLSPEAMEIWADALTHETYSPSKNYEEYEFGGDASLKYLFPRYLRKKFRGLNKRDYTNLNVAYMSKLFQAELSRKLGLNNYVRIGGLTQPELINIQGDIFESFFGALEEITDELIFDGYGILVCENMLTHIFSTVEIDLEQRWGPPKTQVIQIFTRFGLPKPVGVLEKDIFNVYLPMDDVNFLTNKYGVRFVEEPVLVKEFNKEGNVLKTTKSILIGSGRGATKAEAQPNAYKAALDYLVRKGVTLKWADKAKQTQDFLEPEVKPWAKQAEQRYLLEGYKSMFFAMPTKTITKTGAVVQLVGVKEDGKTKVLQSTHSSDQEGRHRTAKGLLVRKYAEGK